NEKVLNKTMFVLRRKKGVKSDPGKCFCSSHCPNCGAPEPNNLSLNTCEYCNSALNDDSKDWMLSDVVRDFNNTKAQEYMNDARKSTKIQDTKGESSEQQSDNINTAQGAFDVFDYYSGKDLISITVAMMLADGFIDNRELNIIYGISKARSVSEKELMQIIERLRKVSDPVKFVLETTAIKLDENLIRLLISIAAADGNIDDTEVEMLHKIAERMGLSQNKLRDMINEAYENNWNKS
ncbi:MAG: TerB family tellurite resistance protein, partial [Candidatus Riflebacteria bacterium]|nr:TerB family tellurite resistance protein [Candidatus Riflebacteria bacterium]